MTPKTKRALISGGRQLVGFGLALLIARVLVHWLNLSWDRALLVMVLWMAASIRSDLLE